uniref:Photosystem II protein J n=1 Tax=Phedimus aizoon TaxID=116726 RepID=A0A6B9R5I7_9MAGN|nr:photosystem II protein J [Phedimus aizoon]
MADTTGRIPLWIIGTVTGIAVIGLLGNRNFSYI